MATKIGIYNSALNLLGQQPLSTLVEERESRRVLDSEYARIVAKCLKAGNWFFAMRMAAMVGTATPTISRGFTNAYTKPSDLVLTFMGSNQANLQDALKGTEWMETPLNYLSNGSALTVQYTSNGDAYGMDLEKWGAMFEQYVISELASATCYQITRNPELMLSLKQIAQFDLGNAREIEAVQASPGLLPFNVQTRKEFLRGGNVEEPMPFAMETATQKR